MKSSGVRAPDPELGTALVHSDDNNATFDVSPPISVSSTFKVPRDISPQSIDLLNPTHHVYSRYTQSISTRVEQVIGTICNGYAITYSSGLAAVFAALVHINPKRIAISEGYHGCHGVIEIYRRIRREIEIVGIDADFESGDLCWIESPLNPTGEVRNIKMYANKAHAVGAVVVVDSTFAPPPLQDPFKWGADMVMHSATKYFGGHSDLLGGVLVVKTEQEIRQLIGDRVYLGNTMGSLDAWLLLRSLRTMHLRVEKQSSTATDLVRWLHSLSTLAQGQVTADGVKSGMIQKVWHSSLQQGDDFDPRAQLEGGYNPTFAVKMSTPEMAAALPFLLNYFVAATSLGGVESLIEQRSRSDPQADPRIVRISVGVEDLKDLKQDLTQAFKQLEEQVKANAKL